MNRARQEKEEQRFLNGRIGTIEELDASGIKAGFTGWMPIHLELHTRMGDKGQIFNFDN